MALTRCSECSKEISTQAETCPHCGFRRPRQFTFATLVRWILYAMVAFLGLVFFRACGIYSDITRANPNSRAATTTGPASVSPAAAPHWEYIDSTDEMTGKPVRQASIQSSNTVALEFPYSSTTSARLNIRTHPRHGRDVIVQLSSGQTLCKSYEDCTLLVRFDGDPPREYAGAGPSDYSSETVFIRNYTRFVSRLRTAGKVMIQIPMYKAGGATWEFSTSDLVWDKLPAPTKPMTPYERRMQSE